MAIFRKIHTSFWSDTFIQELDNDHKLFYLYLLTNEKTKQCGIYEISKKQISFELGYSIDRVSKLLAYFVKTGKIMYSEETKEIAIKNWNKFNGSTSPLVVKCINSELCNVKNRVLIEYVNGIYTASQEEEEQEQEQEEEQEDNLFDELWSLYTKQGNKKTSNSAFNNLTKKEIEIVKLHIPDYIKNHIDNDKMNFLPHFSTYLNQKRFNDELPYKSKQIETVSKSYSKLNLND
jgi:hypothetical protein